MQRCVVFRPYKPSPCPAKLVIKETFEDGSRLEQKPDLYYEMFEHLGDVYVFAVNRVSGGKENIHCAKYTPGGMCILSGDVVSMLYEFRGKADKK